MDLRDKQLRIIREFIKENVFEMVTDEWSRILWGSNWACGHKLYMKRVN